MDARDALFRSYTMFLGAGDVLRNRFGTGGSLLTLLFDFGSPELLRKRLTNYLIVKQPCATLPWLYPHQVRVEKIREESSCFTTITTVPQVPQALSTTRQTFL